MRLLPLNLDVKTVDQIENVKIISEDNNKIVAELEIPLTKNIKISVGKIIYEKQGNRILNVKFIKLDGEEILIANNKKYFDKIDNISPKAKIEKLESIKFFDKKEPYYFETHGYKMTYNNKSIFSGFDEENIYIGKEYNNKIIVDGKWKKKKDICWFFTSDVDNDIRFKMIEYIRSDKPFEEIFMNIIALNPNVFED